MDTESIARSRRVAVRAAVLCGVGAALLGVLGLTGWAFDLPLLIRIVPRLKAIAPSVALGLTALGIVLLRHASGRMGRRERQAAIAVVALISLFGLLEVVGLPFGADLNLEDALTGFLSQVLSKPFETMSPAAGALMFLIGASLLALLLEPTAGQRSSLLGNAAGALALVSLAAAAVFVLGYVYGSPLLYGGRALPIAATASLGAFILSIGVLAATGPSYWPQRTLIGPSARAQLLRVFVPLTVMVVLGSSMLDDLEVARAQLNHALLASVLAIASAVLAAAVVARVARGLGEAMDAANLARQQAERARAEIAEHLSNEIAHRVKNNLAMVAGLLQMQIASRPDGKVDVNVLREAIARIRAFALLHERMYDASAEVVDLTEAVRRVAEVSREALADSGVEVSVVGEQLIYPTKAAANTCLMVNELITNGIKHGRADASHTVRIEVALARQNGKLRVSVWSSGNPIPSDFEVGTQRTMGLQVVTGIATVQYHGSFTIVPHNGGTLATVVLDDAELRQDTYASTA